MSSASEGRCNMRLPVPVSVAMCLLVFGAQDIAHADCGRYVTLVVPVEEEPGAYAVT